MTIQGQRKTIDMLDPQCRPQTILFRKAFYHIKNNLGVFEGKLHVSGRDGALADLGDQFPRYPHVVAYDCNFPLNPVHDATVHLADFDYMGKQAKQGFVQIGGHVDFNQGLSQKLIDLQIPFQFLFRSLSI